MKVLTALFFSDHVLSWELRDDKAIPYNEQRCMCILLKIFLSQFTNSRAVPHGYTETTTYGIRKEKGVGCIN
ncbi:hypothetical protein ACOSP7_020773 [Xanthoceras sorbifolium]